MPAIPSVWMESSGWHQESLDWANYAYQHLLAPQVNVKGRMAIVVLAAVVWAFGWYKTPSLQMLPETDVADPFQAPLARILGHPDSQ